MKKTTRLKAFALSVEMTFAMLLSVTASAQSDGFFRRDGDYMYRDWTGIVNQGFGDNVGNTIINQTFGEAPSGSGLLILTRAGSCYAIRKRKKSN